MTADPRQPRNVEAGPLYEAGTGAPGEAGFPLDHSREAQAMTALRRRGFTAEFVVEGDRLRVGGSAVTFAPEDVRIRDYYRFEGTSDPDDMAVIYAIEATDGTRGTLADAFGAYADPGVGALLDRIPVEPTAAPPGWRRTLVPVAIGALAVVAAIGLLRRRTA